MKNSTYRLCIAGNLIGRSAGFVTTQGLVLADLFSREGVKVVAVSSKMNRFARLVEVIWTIFRNRRRIDILMVEVYSGLGFVLADAASFVAKTVGVPVVLVLHGGNLPNFSDKHPNWVKRVFRRAAVLVAPSTFLAENMSRFSCNVRVVPNVIDIENYAFRARRVTAPKLFWMRSFHPIYNPDMALCAFAEIKKSFPEATLTMAGVDKGLQASMKEAARDMGLADAVRFPGFLDEATKVEEFGAADFYLNTNRIDNMPVSVVEACAMGVPVVATDVGGISHLITHGENGLLVSDGNAKAMADAVKLILSDPELAARLSENGRVLAEKSAWPAVRDAWLELFDEIVTRNASHGVGASPGLFAGTDNE